MTEPAPDPSVGLPVDLPPDGLLAEVEALAVELAREGGEHARAGLEREIVVEYKDEQPDKEGRTPQDVVSEIDHAVEAAIRERVGARFPDHAIIGEEVEVHPAPETDFVWAVDPVDGTTNFVNGFPLFAVSVAVLYRGVPVVGAIWCATSHALRPGVYHARRGGALAFEGEPIAGYGASAGVRRRLAAAPGGATPATPKWDNRVTGSAALECAYVAAGIFTSAYFGGLRLWDLAAGVALAEAAGLEAWTRDERGWRRFERFEAPGRLPRNTKEERAPSLRDWRRPLLLGTTEACELIRTRRQGGRGLTGLLRQLRRSLRSL